MTADAANSKILSVDSPAARFSPGNWKGDAGRGGSLYRQSWNNGAWCSFTWHAAPENPTATLLLAPAATSHISYFLNGIPVEGIPASGDIAISGIIPGTLNTAKLYLQNSGQYSRWNNGVNVIRIFGLRIDCDSSAGVAPANRPWVLLVGDSITEGIQAQNGADNYLRSYAFYLERAFDQLGLDTAVSACGFSGWLRPGDGDSDVPAYYAVAGDIYNETASRWNKIDEGVSLFDAKGQISAFGEPDSAPTMILINYMTNDAISGCSLADVQASVTHALAALRSAAPVALIGIIIPFGLQNTAVFPNGAAYVETLRAGVAAYRAAFPADASVILYDFGADVSRTITNEIYANPNGVHPGLLGHALAGSLLAAKCAEIKFRSAQS
jgi:lysophospholipase L1-like esterase